MKQLYSTDYYNYLSAWSVGVGLGWFDGAEGVVDHTMVGLVCSDGQNGVPHHGSLLERRKEGGGKEGGREENRNENTRESSYTLMGLGIAQLQ